MWWLHCTQSTFQITNWIDIVLNIMEENWMQYLLSMACLVLFWLARLCDHHQPLWIDFYYTFSGPFCISSINNALLIYSRSSVFVNRKRSLQSNEFNTCDAEKRMSKRWNEIIWIIYSIIKNICIFVLITVVVEMWRGWCALC